MSTGWLAVLYLHLLAMAFFVGGQVMLAGAIVPVERRSPDPERMRAIARRFGVGSLVALLVLLTTGLAMAWHWNLWASGALQAKLVLVGLVVVLALVHLRFPRAHALSAVIFLCTVTIVWLGLAIAR